MSVERCLENLDDAIAAAKALGLDPGAAVAMRETAQARLGFPSSAYVLALAGGTGVGKSTLLNVIAGENVSAAGARRPTPSDAVAWVSSSRGRELAGLLKWLAKDRCLVTLGVGKDIQIKRAAFEAVVREWIRWG